jgi:hypothetical protein
VPRRRERVATQVRQVRPEARVRAQQHQDRSRFVAVLAVGGSAIVLETVRGELTVVLVCACSCFTANESFAASCQGCKEALPEVDRSTFYSAL